MDRAYAILEFRSVDDDQRIIEGIASTDLLDDHDTVLEPQGVKFKVPFPLLWFHDAESPVGEVLSATVIGREVRIRAQIRKIDEPGAFKDLTDKAWQAVKHRLVKGLSVGFIPLKKVKNRFIEWALKEISLVSLPSNSEATIQFVRSSFAASGDKHPGVSGLPKSSNNPRQKMTNAERITQFENARAAKMARRQALADAADARGETMDASEGEEFDTLEAEVRSIDEHLVRLNSIKLDTDKKLTPVPDKPGTKAAAESRSGNPNIRVRANTEPGIGLARITMAYVQARGSVQETENIIRQRWPDQANEYALEMRAVVAPGTSTDATWASPLVQPSTLTQEFLEYLRPRTVLGKIQGLRRTPFNVRIPSQTGIGTYGWVGERVPKPLTSLAFAATSLPYHKIAGIIVLTEELVRFSSPSAEGLVRDDMVNGIANFVDAEFLGAAAAVATVRPAGIRNGLAANNATGTTEAAARTDLRALINGFTGLMLDTSGVVLVMQETMAFTLGTIVNSVGAQAFPGITLNGGNLLGVPVVTSQNAALSGVIVALHAPSIALADDGAVTIDLSREASLQFESAPTNPPDATTTFRSLWQENLVGLRADRFITWLVLRSGAVRHITAVAYA